MDTEVDSDDGNWPEFPSSIVRTEGCLFGREEVQLPEAFIEQGHIFKEVMSQEMWDNSLSDAQKQHLLKFLPKFQQKDSEEKEETVRQLFDGENFKFGNPLTQFQNRLRDGYYSPDIARYTSLCKQYKYREYKFRQQRYYSSILKELILTRQRVLEEVCHMPPGQPIRLQHAPPPPPKDQSLDLKVKKKYVRLLKEVQEECDVEETSSEEEDEEAVSPVQKSRRQLFKSLGPIPSPEPTTPSVLATFAAKPATMNGNVTDEEAAKAKRPRPISPGEITEEDFRLMLKIHKKRKAEAEDLPELDTQNITLHDILSRCQANKKTTTKSSPSTGGAPAAQTSPLLKKKMKGKDRDEKKAKKRIKSEPMDASSMDVAVASPTLQPTATSLDAPSDMLTREHDIVPDFPLPDTGPEKLESFFSLIRDMISDFPDQKVTTAKLEEHMRDWQDSPYSSLNSWFPGQPSWVNCVASALKFLSGDVFGLSVENFIPYLDYKERAQQWKWIGAGRDTDPELSPLCLHWLKHKDSVSIDGLESSHGSPPPARAKTAFVVRPTSHEEKTTFQEQEKRRFDNPHKAFIYRLHGYESVVGPVKGVYNKDNAMNKAREHALLVSDRPAFVTILTLVRDAAARLPNGEGTRGDICELLKDSQFLAPGVTDTQVNTVVSGALDRLHSEKDPCVKYDVNRKLWIYLHRNRTEDEFERIHQAQGAAVKAKKSLQKPKTAKTIKDAISAQSTPRVSAPTTLPGDGSLSLDDLASLQTQQTLTGTALLQSPKSLGQVPPFSRTPHSSPKQQTASPKHTNLNLNMTSSAALSASLAQSPLKNPAHLLQPQALAQPTVSNAVGSPMMASQPMPGVAPSAPLVKQDLAGRKVAALTLLQQQALLRQATSLTGQPAQPQAVSLTTKGEIILQRPPGTIVQSAGSPTIHASQVPSASKLICLASVTSGVTTVATSMASADSQTVARLIQQVSGQQMVSVSNLLAAGGAGGARIHTANPRTTTIKIQGGSIMQPVGGGKPIHIGGKPLSQVKGRMQLSGKSQQPLGVIQTPQGTLSAISIIPQTLTSNMVTLSQQKVVTAAGTPVIALSSASGLTEVSSATPHQMVVSATPASGHPRMSIITQAGPVSSAHSVHLGGQPRVVAPTQGGIVVTHLTPGISLRPGLTGVGGAKMVSAGHAGLTQLIMQQAPQGMKTATGETVGVMPTVSQGVTGTPIIVSNAGGKAGQNIQVVRTMLSQQGAAGLKPGQATILISQPTLPNTILTSSQVIQTSAAAAKSGRGSPKGKPQPVYARIITPPPGMKLTTMAPGQTLSQPGLNVIQTAMGKLLNNVTTAGGMSLHPVTAALAMSGSTVASTTAQSSSGKGGDADRAK